MSGSLHGGGRAGASTDGSNGSRVRPTNFLTRPIISRESLETQQVDVGSSSYPALCESWLVQGHRKPFSDLSTFSLPSTSR
eukprot:3182961-Prymnesium_polylepis.1